MSPQFYDIGVKSTTGLQTVDRDIREMQKGARRALSKSSTILARRMRDKPSKRRGPAAPGDPPPRAGGGAAAKTG